MVRAHGAKNSIWRKYGPWIRMLMFTGYYDAAATLWREGRWLLAELLRRENRVIIVRKNF